MNEERKSPEPSEESEAANERILAHQRKRDGTKTGPPFSNVKFGLRRHSNNNHPIKRRRL